MSISLNMIIGQKVEPYLEFALLSTKWCDEHVIVNTGKEDNPNLEVVRKVLPQAKIVQFSGPFNFSAARNLALDNSTRPWILWQDADEVHFDRFEGLVREILSLPPSDGIQLSFTHFLLDFFHYQSIDQRVNIFSREGKRWTGEVHERVQPFQTITSLPYVYHHYGYTKPQKDIYENWRLYWSLKEDEKWKLNEKRNPDDIISDRVTVAKEYYGEYPEVIQSFIQSQRPKVKDYKLI